MQAKPKQLLNTFDNQMKTQIYMSFCHVHIVVQFHHWYKYSYLNTPKDK